MRELSSKRTIIFKCVIPVMTILTGCAILTVCLFWVFNEPLLSQYLPHMNDKPIDKIFLPFFGFMCVLIGAAGLTRHKRVFLDDSTIIVSNYLTDVRIPITDIATVKQVTFKHPYYIAVEFTHETHFGRRITFLPHWQRSSRWFKPPEYSVVTELQQLIAMAKRSQKHNIPMSMTTGEITVA
jgi:hypothetical protein